MINTVEQAFRSFISCLQIAKLYDIDHPKFKKFLDEAYQSLKGALGLQNEIVIGIVGEELAYESEILFELSKAVKTMIQYLKSRDIERMVFSAGLEKEELRKFISFLIMPKDQIKIQPQEYLNLSGVRNINVGKIKASGGQEAAVGQGLGAGEIDYTGLYNTSMENCSNSVENVLNLKEVDYLNLKFTVNNVLEGLLGGYQELLKLVLLKRFDQVTFVHIMNVSVLSMYFSSRLGLNKEDILDIGIAGLFHDLGKLYVSRKILNKPGRLSDEEFTKIKGHTVFGAELLLKHIDDFGVLPVLAAFEHHIKNDFRTYPQVPYPRPPHLASSIISICDIYDALFQRRSYKIGYPPNIVYDIMMKEREKYFQPGLVDEFFKRIGVWPIGAIVALNDKSIAIVRDVNASDIFAPRVEVVSPQEQKRFIDLKETKEQLKIEKALDTFTEGREFAALI
jgi:HD-GYP domain-containing protein (c-di-GMP phosphodiesterase class II)